MEPYLLLLLRLLLLTAALTANTVADEPLQEIPLRHNYSSVTQLKLAGSRITLTEKDRQTLAKYSQLEELNLDDGRVTQIPGRYFAKVHKLRVLSLSQNKISSLDAESFSGLDALTQLDLSRNQLTSIDVRLFTQLRKIEVNLKIQKKPNI